MVPLLPPYCPPLGASLAFRSQRVPGLQGRLIQLIPQVTLCGATLSQHRHCCLHHEGLTSAAHHANFAAEPTCPGSLAQRHGSPSSTPQARSPEVLVGLLTTSGEDEATHLALLEWLNLGQCLLSVGLQ